jgi:acetoin utilization deacetylase AcuC-like enzyme
LFHALDHREAKHATVDDLALAHDPGYIARVRALASSGGGMLDADTVVSAGSWDAGTAAAGAVLGAVDLAVTGDVTKSFCAVRPPGHHALRNTGMGFCLFGSIALGAHHARTRHGVSRVLIVDWDVHHGNGTQALVQDDAEFRFVSMHQWPWYPGTGPADDRGPYGTVRNVPRPPGLTPQAYRDALLQAVDDITRGWTPELVMLSAGFDSLRGDPLGGFTLEMDDVTTLTHALVDRANTWCGGRLVSTLEGGYDPVRLGEAVVTHLRALAFAP